MRTFIPATCNRAHRESGFTLVELMIVITIIALMSAAVVIAIPDPRGRLVDDAERFAARVGAARDHAIIGARPVNLWVDPNGYGFESRSAGAWVAMQDAPFSATRWRPGTQAQIGGEKARASLSFDSIGIADRPLRVILSRDGQRLRMTVGADGKVAIGG